MEIKKEHIKPNLLKLLEENNCVEAFLKNANTIGCSRIVFTKQNDCKYGQLSSAFIWKDSTQGNKFWSNINEQLPND